MRVVNQDQSLESHRLRNLLGGVLDGDAANLKQAETSKSISVLSPQTGDSITLFYTRYAITIQEVIGVVSGSGSPSVGVTVYHSTSRAAALGTIVNGGTVNSTSTGNSLTLDDTEIPADSWVWISISSVSGTVDEFHLTLFHRVDP